MSFSFGSNSVVTITGLTKPSDTIENQKSWTTGIKYENISCYIEQMSAKNTLLFAGGVSAKLFTLLTETVLSVTESDKITDDHGRTFSIQAVNSFVGDKFIPDHTELILVQKYPS